MSVRALNDIDAWLSGHVAQAAVAG
jgi:hypothetical protein